MSSLSADLLLKAAATAMLLFAVVSDLKTRKVKNAHVISFFVIGLVLSVAVNQWTGLKSSAASILTAGVLTVPLVYAKMLGGGDSKIFLAVATVCTWTTTINVLFYSMIWGALLGLVRILIAGEFRSLVTNMGKIAARHQVTDANLHKIPFTVALFFGWMSHLSLLTISGGGLF